MRPSATAFEYNLGLRNMFEYEVIDEDTGLPKREPVVDQYGNPVTDEDGNQLEELVTETMVPDIYKQLYYTSGYNVTNSFKEIFFLTASKIESLTELCFIVTSATVAASPDP